MQKYICKIIKAKLDKRDYIYNDNITKNIPEILDYRSELTPIRDQGDQGTCFAQSAACVKEWQEKRDYGFSEYFSPQFLYDLRPNFYDELKGNDQGMSGRDVMKLLKNVGICPEKMYPYGTSYHRENIPPETYSAAKRHVIKGYARVITLQDLKRNLYKNGPCLITFPVYNFGPKFWKKGAKNYGGHAVVVVGYTKNAFILRNSWGYNWGKKGYTYYPFSEWGNHWDIWTTIDEKTLELEREDFPNVIVDEPLCCNLL